MQDYRKIFELETPPGSDEAFIRKVVRKAEDMKNTQKVPKSSVFGKSLIALGATALALTIGVVGVGMAFNWDYGWALAAAMGKSDNGFDDGGGAEEAGGGEEANVDETAAGEDDVNVDENADDDVDVDENADDGAIADDDACDDEEESTDVIAPVGNYDLTIRENTFDFEANLVEMRGDRKSMVVTFEFKPTNGFEFDEDEDYMLAEIFEETDENGVVEKELLYVGGFLRFVSAVSDGGGCSVSGYVKNGNLYVKYYFSTTADIPDKVFKIRFDAIKSRLDGPVMSGVFEAEFTAEYELSRTIGFYTNDQCITLKLPYHNISNESIPEPSEIEVLLKKGEISDTSLCFEVALKDGEVNSDTINELTKYSLDFENIVVILKDGTEILPVSGFGSNFSYHSFLFEESIDVNEIEAVSINGQHLALLIIGLNEE